MQSGIFILTALLAVLATSVLPKANKIKSTISHRQQERPRIAGGAEAPLHAFPYQVALKSDRMFYSGALITESWVITTASVAKNWLLKDSIAILGAHFPKNKEFSQQKINIDDKIIHEYYSDKNYGNDIALLHLERPAELNSYVATIMLAPFNSRDFKDSRLVISVYGYTAVGAHSDRLRYVVVNGISNSDCRTIWSTINEGQICVETTGGKGTCAYDYGAPLMDVDSGLLVGLASLHGACNEVVKPNRFTRVSHFNQWIMHSVTTHIRSVMPHIYIKVPKNFKPKIVEGENAAEKEFPWMVTLNTDTAHDCGGSIVASRWVLTAAHCCNNHILVKCQLPVLLPYWESRNKTKGIRSGSNYWEQGGQLHQIDHYVLHEDYVDIDPWRSELCLMKIRTAFQYDDYTKPVSLPSDDFQVNDGEELTISGWGFTSPYDREIPDYLQAGRYFRAVSNAKCQEKIASKKNMSVTNEFICAVGGEDGQGCCNGDSGSPLVKGNVQVGTASWVFLPCGSGLPDIFVRTSHAMPWIRKVLGADANELLIVES